MRKIPGGMPLDPPPPNRVSRSLNAKYQFKQYFTGGPINLFRKYPSNPKFAPPFKNSWAWACRVAYISFLSFY